MSQSGFDPKGFYSPETEQLKKLREKILETVKQSEQTLENKVKSWKELEPDLPEEMSPKALYRIADSFLDVILAQADLLRKSQMGRS